MQLLEAGDRHVIFFKTNGTDRAIKLVFQHGIRVVCITVRYNFCNARGGLGILLIQLGNEKEGGFAHGHYDTKKSFVRVAKKSSQIIDVFGVGNN
ncbi:hypothetical protein D3C77_619610 [compost metagenome]